MAEVLSQEVINLYLWGGKVHKDHPDSVKIYDDLKYHINKEKGGKLITERRPNEDEESKKYRELIDEPVTSIAPLRVISALGMIRRSNDWNIQFPENKYPSIIETETLEYYSTKSYPIYGTKEQWLFTVALKSVLTDPNAYIVVLPINLADNEASEYFKPISIFVNSNRVLYPPDKGDYFFFESTDKVDLRFDDGRYDYNKGKVFYYITPTFIRRYEQMTIGNEYRMIEYNNPLGKIPAYKVRAVFREQRDTYVLQDSRLSDMLPELNEARREYSDLQIGKVKTMHAKEWEYDDDPCPECNGLRVTLDPNSTLAIPGKIVCRGCGGTGNNVEGPTTTKKIRPSNGALGEAPLPGPPYGGFFERDVEILVQAQKSFDAHMYRAMEAMHMQTLSSEYKATSGEERRLTAEPQQTTAYNVTEDLVYILEMSYLLEANWRYYKREPNLNKHKEMIPNVPIPEDFTMLPVNYLIDQISTARTGKINSVLVGALEAAAAAKMFYNKPDLAKLIGATLSLNPLPGQTEDEKALKLQTKQVTLLDCVISSYVELFVKTALEKDKNFLGKPREKQMEALAELAQEKITKNEEAATAAILQQQEAQKALGMNTDPGNVSQNTDQSTVNANQ